MLYTKMDIIIGKNKYLSVNINTNILGNQVYDFLNIIKKLKIINPL